MGVGDGLYMCEEEEEEEEFICQVDVGDVVVTTFTFAISSMMSSCVQLVYLRISLP